MAKKYLGRLLTFAAVAGAAAAGISYFLQYKSFHKELDEDFHDFEDDFDDFDHAEEEKKEPGAQRSYVSLTPEKQDPAHAEADDAEAGGADSADEGGASDGSFAKQDNAAAVAQETSSDDGADGDETTEHDKPSSTPAADTTVTVEEITD